MPAWRDVSLRPLVAFFVALVLLAATLVATTPGLLLVGVVLAVMDCLVVWVYRAVLR